MIAGAGRPLHHHDSIGAGGRWRASHDSGSLSRFDLDFTILGLSAGPNFSDDPELGGKLCKIGSTHGVSVARCPPERREIAVGGQLLRQNASSTVEQLQ